MTTATKAIYEIQAKYTGKGDFKQLNNDLKAMGKVESFNKIEQSFVKLNQDFVAAKAKMRELRAEMSKPGNDAMRAEYDRAKESVDKLFSALTKQKEKLTAARTDLKQAGIDVTNLAGEYDKLKESVDGLARVKAARNILDVKSVQETRAQMAGMVQAYRDIATSSKTSAADQLRALAALRQKTRDLYATIATPPKLQAARDLLGITSSVQQTRAQMAGMVQAYRDIATSSKTSAADQMQALAALRQKNRELYATIANPPKLQAARDVLGLTSHKSIAAEIDKARKAYKDLATHGKMSLAELAQAQVRLGQITDELRNKTNGWRDSLGGLRGRAVEMAGALAGVVFPTKIAIEFEGSMAKVNKVLDGTPGELKELGEELQKMSQVIPLSANELAAIAAAGGQLGLSAKDIQPFVDITAKMATAFDMTADEAGTAIGKLRNILNISVGEMGRFGDAIDHLGNNTATNEKNIVGTMMRIGGTSKQFGLAKEQAAALAATMLSLGKTEETSATSINFLLSKMQAATRQTPEFEAALKRIGISAEEMARSVESDPQKAIISFLNTLKKLNDRTRTEVLTDLFGQEYWDDVSTLVQGLDEYERVLGLVADKTEYAGSMQKSFEARLSATDKQLILLRNTATRAGEGVGSGLNELFLPAVTLLKDMAKPIADLTNEFPKLSAAVVGFGSGVVILTTVAKTLPILKMAIAAFSAGVSTKLGIATSSAIELGIALKWMSGLGAAALAGWGFGTWLLQFELVEKAGVAMTAGIHKGLMRVKQAWVWLRGGDTGAVEREIAEIDAVYAEMFANVGREARKAAEEQARAQQTAAQAIKETGEVQRVTSVSMSENARTSHKVMEEAAKKTGEVQKATSISMSENARTSYEAMGEAAKKAQEVQEKAFDELKSKYQSYAAEIRRIQDDIVSNERSTNEQLRDLKRSGMSEPAAWEDNRKQAGELKREAAAVATSFSSAIKNKDIPAARIYFEDYKKLIESAKQKYLELGGEVKNGDRIYRTKAQNIKMVTTEVQSLTANQKANMESMQAALDAVMKDMEAKAKTMGMGDLKDGMDEVEKKWLKIWQNVEPTGKQSITKVISYVGGLKEPTEQIGTNFQSAFEVAVNTSYEATERILLDISRIKNAAGSIKYPTPDSGANGYNLGGLIGELRMANGGAITAFRNMLSGGHFPGFGGGDRRHVVAEDGEYMLDKFRVRDLGLGTVRALHAGRYDIVIRELLKRMRGNFLDSVNMQLGGLVDSMPSLSPQYLAAGGPVTGAGGGDTYNQSVTVNVSGFGGQTSAREIAKTVLNELQKMHRSRS